MHVHVLGTMVNRVEAKQLCLALGKGMGFLN